MTLIRHLAHDGPSGCVSTPRSSASAAPLTKVTVPIGRMAAIMCRITSCARRTHQDRMLTANLRWLSGYRHPRVLRPGLAAESVPRLMTGQGAIIGVGATKYPAEFQGASPERIADLGVGKLVTLISTYDHRIILGAESGDFCAPSTTRCSRPVSRPSPTERKPSLVDTVRGGDGLPVGVGGPVGGPGGGSSGMRSRIWTCQPVTRTSSMSASAGTATSSRG